MTKSLLLTILVALTIGLVGAITFMQFRDNKSKSAINSFAACAAKYPVQESYPERCSVPGGKSFTNPAQSLN